MCGNPNDAGSWQSWEIMVLKLLYTKKLLSFLIPFVNANQNETYMLHGVYIDLYIYMMEQNMHMYTNT